MIPRQTKYSVPLKPAGDDLSEGYTVLSRRTQQIAVPLKRDDCSSYRTEWAGWASVSHPVAAGPLFLGIAQNGLACTGLRSRCSGKAVFGHRTEWGAGWAGLAGLGWLGWAGLQRWQLGAGQFFQGPAAAA